MTSTNAAPMARAIDSSSWSGTIPRTSYALTSAERSTWRAYGRRAGSLVRHDRRAVTDPMRAQGAGTTRRWPRRPVAALRAARLGTGGLADRIGERLEVVGVRDRRRELADVAQDLPAARDGQPHRVLLAQVVGVRLGVAGQRADDRGQVGIGVGQGRDGGPGARRSGCTARIAFTGPDTSARTAILPLRPVPRARVAGRTALRSVRRSSRQAARPGRAPARGIAAAAACAASWPRSRAAAPQAAARSSTTWCWTPSRSSRSTGPAELAALEFAVEEVPPRRARPSSTRRSSSTAASRSAGCCAPVCPAIAQPSIVVYRRPVEARAGDGEERADLVFMVVVELVAEFLGRDVDEIDPP